MGNLQLSLKPGPDEPPILGYFAVGFGILGIFTHGYVFVPLAFVCSIACLFWKQALWGVMGILLSIGGFFTSPVLWAVVAGLFALY